MKYYELLVGLTLKKDVCFKDLPEEMSKAINILFLDNKELKEYHEKNQVKLYCYSGIFPIEVDKTYKEGREYLFKIRFIVKGMAKEFEDLLYDKKNPLFTTLRVVSTTRDIKEPIEKLYTLNPAVITIDKKYWDRKEEELEFVKERILRNTNRKYNFLKNSTEPVYDFIDGIQIANRIPMSFNYKSSTIRGNKFRIRIKKDKMSQELASLILGAGLLEKNSLSFGFCMANQEELI